MSRKIRKNLLDSREGRKKKVERDLRHLQLDLQDRPDHPFVMFNLGMTYADIEQFDEAARWLCRSLEVSDPGESHVRKVYSLLVNTYVNLERLAEASSVCERGLSLYPKDPELLFRRGILLHRMGKLAESAASYKAALGTDDEEKYFSSRDRGIVGFKARHNLAMVYLDMDRADLAEVQARIIQREVPRYRPAQRMLADSLLRQQKFTSARIEAERMLESAELRSEGVVLLAQIAEGQGDWDEARKILQDAVAIDASDNTVLEVLCRHLFDHGQPAEAREAFFKLVQRKPNDGAAHYNLAQVYLREGNTQAAVESFQESLRQRPNHAPTYIMLGYTLRALGNMPEAIAAWREAARLAPTDPLPKKLLEEFDR